MNPQFDIDSIQNYLEELCAQHIGIKHTEQTRAFARHQSMDQVNELKKRSTKVCVVVGEITGQRVGNPDDKMVQRQLVLRVAVYAVPAGNLVASKAAAERQAETIVFDLMTRMELDHEQALDGEGCNEMQFLKPEEFSWEPIEDTPWLLNHYGWDLTVPFRHYMPAYNPDAWKPAA